MTGALSGGNAAAARTLSLSAALLADLAGRVREEAGLAVQAEALRTRCDELAATAEEAFTEARAALADRGGRHDVSLGRSLATAADVPLRVARAGADVALLAAAVADDVDSEDRADAAAAALLAAGAARAAALFVAINLAVSEDDERVRAATSAASAASAAADGVRGGS